MYTEMRQPSFYLIGRNNASKSQRLDNLVYVKFEGLLEFNAVSHKVFQNLARLFALLSI